MDGILLVDKTKGPTSHDVVARIRRLLRIRAVGHAGTLDPMATGLLVIGVGEGTKLLAALTDDDKVYEAVIRLGTETDTLDAEGKVVSSAEVPLFDQARLEAAYTGFLGAHTQRAPIYSAIKRGGETLHSRARRGEEIEAPIREVVLRSVSTLGFDATSVHLVLECGKGFYVRSFARDLAQALGTVGHLEMLRRTRAGGHEVSSAVRFADLMGDGGEAIARANLHTMVDSLGTIPSFTLTPKGLLDASCGRPVSLDDAGAVSAARAERVALVTHDRKLVALAAFENDKLTIVRGFVEGQSRAPRATQKEEGT